MKLKKETVDKRRKKIFQLKNALKWHKEKNKKGSSGKLDE